MSVTVPDGFRAIGYSGVFHLEVPINGTLSEVKKLRADVPFLMPQRGWMALEVTDHTDGPHMVIVRRDSNAIADLMIRSESWKHQQLKRGRS